jgi:hypothetical protein
MKKGTNITTCIACGTQCLRDENDHLVPAWQEIMARNEEIRREKATKLEIYADIGRLMVKWLNEGRDGLELRIGMFEGIRFVDAHDINLGADVGVGRSVDGEEVTPDMLAVWLGEVIAGVQGPTDDTE